ncbi:ATP-binding protein [uncultured Maribacter sp.]|uniref:ATP-binding protein n=1 Tax=uncultured Maribacter sp. TaxID=431308 RepID=UPI0030EB5EF4|tara:strand:+ start:40932 stop:46991 length:6060 start_codon:yes stop_codon:yes gene_type:complete
MRDFNSLIKNTGEVSAIVGYYKQYEICALEIYDALLNNQLEEVEFASKELKKLDDILIICKNYVLAYQVKDITENFTYKSFLNSDNNLFKGSFEDFSLLKSKYPNKEIRAYYISNQKPSSHDKIQSFSGVDKPHFKKFKSFFWDEINDSSKSLHSFSSDWTPIINELKTVSNSNDEELEAFIKSFRFLLEDEYAKVKNTKLGVNYLRIDDIEKISRQIFTIIGKRGNVILNENQILHEFGLLSRYETHFKHSFFVDNEHYQPINETITNLEDLLKNTHGGYIALIGNAGSGKSTLLTKWISGRKENILKYYAYVNKELNNEFGYRGEANIFLKDLLVQIREKQFSQQENLPSHDFQQLQKQLYSELEILSRGGEKTFIIVDGLDHIEREQKVNRSLIDILPNPEQIPHNVYFILGTRTTENLEGLPDRIKINLQDENRVIVIAPLSIAKVTTLLDSHQISLAKDQISALHSNTLGHPLFLRYTIEEIKNADESLYDTIISQKDFKGDIYDEYKIFWSKNKDEDEFVDILGIISRFRYSYVDISLLPNFIKSRKHWNKVQKVSEHYFFRKNNIWQYFHNSFKEFLKEETAKDFITDQYNEKLNKNYHQRIYDVIKDLDNDYEYNILFHLYEAQEFTKVVELGNQEFFRSQWFSFRNYKYIFEDIKITAKASYKAKKPKALFDCFVSYSELDQRINNFYLSNYTSTFLNLNLIALSNSFVFDATELLVSNSKVLEYALDLYKKGYEDLAYELLKKGEPNYLLDIAKQASPNRYDRNELNEIDEVSLIIDWAKLASLYNELRDVFKRIENLEIVYDEHRPNNSKRNIIVETVEGLTDLYIELEDWSRLNQLEKYVRNLDEYNQFFFYFDIVWELPNQDAFYEKCLDRLTTWKITQSNPINKRLALFNTLRVKNLDKAKIYFKQLLPPNKIKSSNNFDRFDEGFLNYIFHYSGLFYITSKNFEKEPDFTPIESKITLTAYYKEFAKLGKAFAYIYHDSPEAAKEFRFRFKELMHYFHFDVTDYQYEYSISQNKSSLVNLILNISSKISNEFFNEILEEIDEEWSNYSRYWGNSSKQQIIDFVIDTKINDTWCENYLNHLHNSILEYSDISSRIESGIEQIELWSKLDKYEKGNDILNRLMSISVDIRYEKDYQLDYMIDWLVSLEKDKTEEFESYVKSLDSIKHKTSHSTDYIVKQIFNYALGKGNSFNLFKYLLFNQFTNLNDALESFLSHFIERFSNNTSFIKLYSRVILNHDGSNRFRSTFLNKLFSLKPSLDDLKLLVQEVNIYAVYQQRKDYLSAIQEYAQDIELPLSEIGIEQELTSKLESNSPSELRLKGLDKMEYAEVLVKVDSYQDILNLLEQEDQANSFFRWSKIIIEKIDKITDEEIKSLAEKINLGVSELADIAEHLGKKNRDKKTISKLLHKAIANSSDINWSWVYDGGSKIKTYKQLIKIDEGDEVRDIAFNDFANSIEISSSRLFNTIDDIFKIIDPKFSYDDYYSHIKGYKDLFIDIHYEENDSPSIVGIDSDDKILESLILFLTEIPSGFDNIIFEILLEEFQSNQPLVKAILNHYHENEYDFKFIKLLAGLSLIDLDFVWDFHEKLTGLVNHDRYDIHSIGCRIVKRMGEDYESFYHPKTKTLPFIYTIEIVHSPELIVSGIERMDRIQQTGYLRETNDPIEYCNIYMEDIKKISEDSGLEVINIATRIKNIGESYHKQPDWLNGLSEKEIRNIYKHDLELKIPYRRPQSQKVWCGLMVVLKELLELDYLDKWLCDFISNQFEEETFFIGPTKKPKFISSIIGSEERDYAPSAKKGWVYELSDDYLRDKLSFQVENGFFVLAENSIIEGQGDGISSEIRQAFVAIEKESDIKDNHTIFNVDMKARIEDYHNLSKNNSICFYNWILNFGKKRNWLAINPSLAKAMNLKLSDEGNFRWVNENGEIVVESVFWRNNDEGNRNRNLHSESGFGWFVIISQEGLNRIKSLGVGHLFHHKKIFRRMEFHQRRYNTHIKEEHDHWNITEIDI